MESPPKRKQKRRYGRALRNLLLLIVAIVFPLFLRGCVLRPATSYPGSHFNHDTNAAWLGIEWVNEVQSESAIAELANDLDSHEIAYAYVYVSYLRANGDFGSTYSHAANFLATFRKARPNIKLLAWYGIPTTYASLADPIVRNKITAFSRDMVSLGFDGIQIDPEPIGDNDSSLLTLLDEIRQTFRTSTNSVPILSISTRTAWPIFPDAGLSERIGPIFWSAKYYREVAERSDQVAIMTYDSALPSPILYRSWTRFQVIQISKALAGVKTQLFIGVPTSEEESPTHHVAVENMTSGIEGVIDGLNDEESLPNNVTGVAIYPYWETDSTEWSTYDSKWLGK